MNVNQEDSRGWYAGPKGSFSIKSCYRLLDSSRDLAIPSKEVSNHFIHLKVQFFTWTVSLGKISTKDEVIQKGMYLTNICLLCYRDIESIVHILFHYLFVVEFWNALLFDFDMCWVASPTVSFMVRRLQLLIPRVRKSYV